MVVYGVMAPKLLVMALLAVLAGAGVLAPATGKRAEACSVVLERDHRRAVEKAVEQSAIVIVGEVTNEQASAQPAHLERTTYMPYESTIRVVAALKGNPEREITLSPLGFLAPDCTGGPRLPAGERLLLFLGQYGPQLSVYGYEQGKYVLAEGKARTEYFPPMPTEDLLRQVASLTGAPPEQLENALSFARGEVAPTPQPDIEALPADGADGAGPSALLIGLIAAVAIAGAVVLGGTALYARLRARR